MAYGALVVLLLTGYGAFSLVSGLLDLNVLTDDSAKSTELLFQNARVYTHDVNPGYRIENVTQGGLKVWSAPRPGFKLTNAVLMFDINGPRVATLTINVDEEQTQLLYFLYTVDGWTNLSYVNPADIKVEHPASSSSTSLNLSNGEQYFNKDPKKEEDESYKTGKKVVEMDLLQATDLNFNYRFTYSSEKFTYFYKPKEGVFVQTINEGDTQIWKASGNQMVTEVTVLKKDDEFHSLELVYFEGGEHKELTFLKANGAWNTPSHTYVKPTTKSEALDTTAVSRKLGEAVKPGLKLTSLDFRELPDPPFCRKFSYEVDGIGYNTVFLGEHAHVRKVYEGLQLVFEVPTRLKLVNVCYYTRSDDILLVDFLVNDGKKTEFIYFEKTLIGYQRVSRYQFTEKLENYKLRTTVIDISQNSQEYLTTYRTKGKLEQTIFAPAAGYYCRTVVDGGKSVFEATRSVLEVTFYKKDENKVLSVLYQSKSYFAYEYFHYSLELEKWIRVSEEFFFSFVYQFTNGVKTLVSIDITTGTATSKQVQVNKSNQFHHYTFKPSDDVDVEAVYDDKELVWKRKNMQESCVFVWYQYNYKLLYVISRERQQNKSYRYQLANGAWSVITDEEFKSRFNFAYSASLALDIRSDITSQYDVHKFANSVYIMPKMNNLITRIRHGNKFIWIGTSKLKCKSVKLLYGHVDTYMKIDITNYEGEMQYKYFKTVSGDTSRWRSFSPESQNFDDVVMELDQTMASDANTKAESAEPSLPKDDLLPSPVEMNVVGEVKPEKGSENAAESKDSDSKAEAGPGKTPETKTEKAEVKQESSEAPSTAFSAQVPRTFDVKEAGEGSVLKPNPEVLPRGLPPSIDYFKPKNTPFNPSTYNPRLALTMEPHNPDQVVLGSAEDKQVKVEDTETAQAVSTKSTAEADEDECVIAPEPGDEKVSGYKGPTKVMSTKKTSPSGKKTDYTKVKNTDSFKKQPRGVKSDDLLRVKHSHSTDSERKTQEATADSSVQDQLAQSLFAKSLNQAYEEVMHKSEESRPASPVEFDDSASTVSTDSARTVIIHSGSDNTSPLDPSAPPLTVVDYSPSSMERTKGRLYLEDHKDSEHVEFIDARKHGFDYLLFNARAGSPIRELRDGHQTVWSSHTSECLAVSYFVRERAPKAVELFVKCSEEVVRRFYEYKGYRWVSITPERYLAVTARK